jgi:hypothetical protein
MLGGEVTNTNFMMAMDILHRLSGCRGGCLEIDQPETRIVYGFHVWKQIETKIAIL